MLRLDKFRDTPLESEPYKYLVVRDFVEPQALRAAQDSYPEVPGGGSHPPHDLTIEGGFARLIEALKGEDFRRAVEEKFGLDLSERPIMYTVRGYCRARDGQIHPDSKTKIITVLLYMNEENWPSDTGRLRILNGPDDLEDYAAEVEPAGGTLVVFQRADNSWHGHHSFEGRRRAIQVNWVTDQSVVDREQGRHRFSSRLKRLFRPGAAA